MTQKRIGDAMLEKELSELSDQSLLELYKAIIPSTTMLEYLGDKLEVHESGTLSEIKEKSTKKNEMNFDSDKSILNYKRHLIEMKIFSLKLLEEINHRELETNDSYSRINNEIDYIEGCTEFLESNNPPNLTSVPQGSETLPYLNRGLKK